MAEFYSILESLQWIRDLKKPMDFKSQIPGLLGSQESIPKSLSGISIITELAKSMQYYKSFETPGLTAVKEMGFPKALFSQMAIPQTTFDAINSINKQHEMLFGRISAMTKALNTQSPAITQIRSLNFALSSISGQLAAIAARHKDWTIFNDFEEVTEQAIDFSESLIDEITEDQQKQFQVLLALISAFVIKHKQKAIVGIRFLEIILVLYGFYAIFSPKPELATQENIRQIDIKQDTLIHYISLVHEQLKEVKEYRITNRKCEVKLKPRAKTLTLAKLPKDFEIIVIQIHHKWIYVSYFDTEDNLPQTGWIMKKYLDKPE